MGLKETILAKRRVKKVAIPEWDAEVYVRELSQAERKELSQVIQEFPEESDLQIAFRCLADESGQRVFTTPADLEQLANGPGATGITRFAGLAADFNALSEERFRELLGNSAAIPTADSPSGSANGSGSPIQTTSPKS